MQDRLAKDEAYHLILSIIAGLIIGNLYHNYYAIGFAILSGFLIDSDHVIDYLIYNGWQFDLKFFLSGESFDKSGKLYVVFHGFEYVIILALLGYFLPNLAWLFYSLALSNFLHLMYDTLYNGAIWPTYFLSFRAAKNFDHKILYPGSQK